jgi:SAM-dependent methyltransferase
MIDESLSADFFEAKYRDSADPWDFARSTYEQDRYDEIVKSLGGRHFHRAFEPGCSIGVLTERLAAICDQVYATDISATAVARARARCSGHPGVFIEEGSLTNSLPSAAFDLIVLSEVGYYLDPRMLVTLARNLTDCLTADGMILAAHWLGTSKDHVLTGDQVHDILSANLNLERIHSRRHEGFRIDLWSNALWSNA